MKAALLTADQPQPASALMVTMPGPPLEGNCWLDDPMEYEQVGVAPLWFNVKVWPAIVIVPVREVVSEFDRTE